MRTCKLCAAPARTSHARYCEPCFQRTFFCECGQRKSVAHVERCSACSWEHRRENSNRKQRIIDEDGYVLIWVPSDYLSRTSNGYIREHRYVMERHLGRYLATHENVHHMNGSKQDNRIENLELWSTSQPCGQRVPDKLKWVREMAREFIVHDPDELAALLISMQFDELLREGFTFSAADARWMSEVAA